MNRKHTYRKAYTKDVKIIYGILAGVLVAVILFAIGLGIFTAKRYVIPVMFPSPTITSSQTPTITSTSTITPTVTITLTPSSTPEPTWHIETIDQNGSVGGFSSLVVDRSGEVHIVYFDDHHDRLKYVHGHFSDWSYPDSLDGEWMGLFPLIALDNNQKPHVVHYSRAGQLRYGYLMQSRWKFTAIQDAKISGKISLVFDEHDNPHILYFNKKSNDLTYLTKQNGRWISNFVTNTNDEGYSFQIKIDDLGVIHTCYWVSDKGLAYRRKSNGIWRQPHYIEDNPKMGLFPSMEVTSDGKPHISFYDQTTKTLKYAYLDDNEWHVEIIDDRGNVGKYSSLVIDQNQSKHIVYYDETNTALKYAHEVNGGWDTNVIDDGGDMGKNSSIFLDSKGFLHVSYYDATAEDLKYGVYRP